MNKNRPKMNLLLTFIVLTAGLLRLVAFDNPPLDFHPARQLHSALIARGFYLNQGGDLPNHDAAYEHEALLRGQQEPWIEPPIFEYLTARGYALIGDADLRLPRALTALFWLIGALGLYHLTARMLSPVGSIISVLIFLFLPYGVYASRSFQPDPLMVMLIIWALDAMLEWQDGRGMIGAIQAGILTGLAILVKQVAIFPLGLAALFLILAGKDGWRCWRKADFWLFGILSLLPVALYNYWGIRIAGFLAQQYQGRFFIREWLNPGFYIRWIRKLDVVFSLPLSVFGLVGCAWLKQKRHRLLWLGYFLGYVLYGLALPHHIGTHDYYQLLLFPPVAVGAGSLVQVLWEKAHEVGTRLIRAALIVGIAGLLLWNIADTIMTLRRTDYRPWPQRWQELAQELEPWPNQINTIGIMADYGAGMMYWGLRTPIIWDQNIEKLPQAEADMTIRTAMKNRTSLVVTDLERFYEQPRLQQWLIRHARIAVEAPDYLIYDLTEVP